MMELNITLPDHFLGEEERCDYVISEQMKKVWAIQLDMLVELLRVCKKHDIKIFASGGTLLGAVRHKGFIPWDDDIDMMMFRPDYEKLCQVAPQEFKAPYFFQTEYTDPGSLRGHAQLRNSETTGILCNELNERYSFNQGIFLDIFPLDNVIDDEALFQKQYQDAMKYRDLARKLSKWSSRFRVGQPDRIKGKVKKIIGPVVVQMMSWLELEQRAYRKFEETCQRYNHLQTEKVSTLCLEFANKGHFKYRVDFEEIVMLPFEFMEIPGGSRYDHALRQLYGDYTIIKKGTSNHGQILLNPDVPYNQIINSEV